MIDLTKESRKGQEAKRILENDLVRETLDGMRQAIMQKWQDAPINDREGQHELKIMFKLLTDFENNLKNLMKSGQYADFEIEAQKKREQQREKIKRFA